MSLSSAKQAAKEKVKQIHDDMLTREESSTEEYASRLIDALEEWIKEAAIKYTTGLVAGSNPVTGNFTGKLE
ncbi:hypothetical protein EIB75_10600 [Epilithonimonas vandammei]|uniref:Uncharacterized protein n=1 Tax=Epilithonimonas vandammei TaxID=2487072 RepID=A0A3G8Z9J9_9FLAO|nr:hypothetical protein [Epilithonimonas vandammei]AZI53908.1 hypothetical protein EIB75_00940 [Epilithonimonas vandammei]AZI55672.1 hypothetical protein EIB75_10600 [Epilithonimonas vandammei]